MYFQFTSFYKSHVHIRFYLGGLGLAGERCQVCGIPVWRQNQQIEEANGKVTSVSKIGITGFHLLSVGSNRADKHEGRKWCLTEIVSIVPSNRFYFSRGYHQWLFFMLQTIRQKTQFAHFLVLGHFFLSSVCNNPVFVCAASDLC